MSFLLALSVRLRPSKPAITRSVASLGQTERARRVQEVPAETEGRAFSTGRRSQRCKVRCYICMLNTLSALGACRGRGLKCLVPVVCVSRVCFVGPLYHLDSEGVDGVRWGKARLMMRMRRAITIMPSLYTSFQKV